MIFLSHSMHSMDGIAGAHTINQHGIFYYGCVKKKIKSKVFNSTNTNMAKSNKTYT